MAEVKMLRFSLGVKIIDKIGTNVYIGGTVQVGRFGKKNERKD